MAGVRIAGADGAPQTPGFGDRAAAPAGGEPAEPTPADDTAPLPEAAGGAGRRRLVVLLDTLRARFRGPPAPAGSVRRVADRAAVRYGAALGSVAAAVAASFLLDLTTGRFLSFPFYAAVVISAWFGIGPGLLSLVLSAVAVEDIWTPPLFDLHIEIAELPSFVAFVIGAFMSFAWSAQRRRAQSALEVTVAERTADLVQANASLKVEIAEREAAEQRRKRTEQALREAEAELARTLRLATVAELAAAIAHEINQPLAAIVANGAACSRSLAQQPPLLDNAREAASCIVADGHRAGDVIARIRSLFNKDAPKQRLLNVNEVIRQVLDLSRGAIDRQRVEVRVELAPSPLVMADPVQLQQVMVNLVTNALEAMTGSENRPAVLTVRSEIGSERRVSVIVEDSGGGLDPERASHIFDSFYTTKPDGIGVGLAISRSIIEAHDGTLWVSPGEQRGARFGFTLAGAQSGPAAP